MPSGVPVRQNRAPSSSHQATIASRLTANAARRGQVTASPRIMGWVMTNAQISITQPPATQAAAVGACATIRQITPPKKMRPTRIIQIEPINGAASSSRAAREGDRAARRMDSRRAAPTRTLAPTPLWG